MTTAPNCLLQFGEERVAVAVHGQARDALGGDLKGPLQGGSEIVDLGDPDAPLGDRLHQSHLVDVLQRGAVGRHESTVRHDAW